MHSEASPSRGATPPDFERDVHCLFGLPIDAIDLAGAERRIRAAAAARMPCFMSTPNLNFVIESRSEDAFRNAILHSELTVADGMPLVWLARLIGIPIRERVAGASLFEALRGGEDRPLKVNFFGGPDGVAEVAGRWLALEAKGAGMRRLRIPGIRLGRGDEQRGDDPPASTRRTPTCWWYHSARARAKPGSSATARGSTCRW
jgi:Glycosyl transferase WecG/TagA/CpsF family